MSDAVDQKAVELMDKAANAVEAFAAKLDTLAQEYGPEVIDAALAVARIEAADRILGQLAAIAVTLALVWAARGCWRAHVKDDENPAFIIGLVASVAAGAFCSMAFLITASIWPWVGIIEPKLWIAKRVLGL